MPVLNLYDEMNLYDELKSGGVYNY